MHRQTSKLDSARLLMVLQLLSAALVGTPTPNPASLPVSGCVLEPYLLGKLGESFGDCLFDSLFKLFDLLGKLFFWGRCSCDRGRRVGIVVADGRLILVDLVLVSDVAKDARKVVLADQVFLLKRRPANGAEHFLNQLHLVPELAELDGHLLLAATSSDTFEVESVA